MIKGETYTVHIGNNLDILPTLPDNSVDSIVTDPPYELGFMGKKWDSSGIAYSVELWRECLRVLKPGGHLLSFGGTRTWHRVAVGIEDAGFEVRDSIAWMYGSGFPKSLDVSKAIDKSGGIVGLEVRDEIALLLTETKLTDAFIAAHVGVSRQLVGAWRNNLSQLTPIQAQKLKELFDNKVYDSYEQKPIGYSPYYSEGRKKNNGVYVGGYQVEGTIDERLITAPSTPEAQQWEGWGTALKPAFEPIVVARKPLIGTVAANVLEHGTGALNIDGSRIGTEVLPAHSSGRNALMGGLSGSNENGGVVTPERTGRWPANVILDEYSAELLDEQSDASRFFYVAKASKRDRNEGLEGLPEVDAQTTGMAGKGMPLRQDGSERKEPVKQNFHPTVKPTQLMRYLVKLVTPPGGTVLDPFTGSGSTGKAAILESFRFIGCELTEDYIPIIEGRLQHAELMKAEEEAKKDEALF